LFRLLSTRPLNPYCSAAHKRQSLRYRRWRHPEVRNIVSYMMLGRQFYFPMALGPPGPPMELLW
jgi:hypothetical protein